MRYLLDTHVLVRWLIEPKKLSRNQTRTLKELDRRRETFGVSAVSLLEIAVLTGHKIDADLKEMLERISGSPAVGILPITVPIATEVWAIGETLRDPMDRSIVATARVHRLRLLTSDQRIVDSKLVPTID